MYDCLHIRIFSLLYAVTLYKNNTFFLVKSVFNSLLATVENITDVNLIWYYILILHTSLISNAPGCAQSVADKHYYCTAAKLVGYKYNCPLPTYHVVGVFIQTEKGLHERFPISLKTQINNKKSTGYQAARKRETCVSSQLSFFVTPRGGAPHKFWLTVTAASTLV